MPNAAIVNFAAGETSPKSRGRFDLPWYAAGARKMLNFIPEIPGPARFRPGFKMLRETRGGQVARLIPFQLSSSLGYMLEFTPGKMRAYLNEELQSDPSFFLSGRSIDFDDFADGDFTLSPVWTPFVAARVAVVANRMVATAFDPGGGVRGGAARTPFTWAHGTFKFDAEITGDGHVVIASTNLVYSTDANGVTTWTGDGYGIYRTGGGNYKFVRFDAGVATDLIDLGVSGTGLKQFKIVRPTGTSEFFTVSVDGVQKGVVADTTYTANTGNFFGILADAVTAGDTTTIDNIRIPPLQVTTSPERAIGAVTQADPAVISPSDPANFANDDEYIVLGVGGMSELNQRQVKAANKTATTIEATDPTTGNDIDSSGFGAYTDGGFMKLIAEITTPYFENDLDGIAWATSARDGLMYMTHPKYEPKLLSVDAAGAFTLVDIGIINDPFTTILPTSAIIDVKLGEQTIIVLASGVINESVTYTITGVLGTVELNGQKFRLRNAGSFATPWARLVSVTTEEDIDSRDFTPYTGASGIITPDREHPIAPAFYEGRLGFFGTNQRPNTIFLSRSPSTTGNPRYQDMTGGTNDDDAVFFALAPADGRVDFMSWAKGSAKHLIVGTFGGPFRVSGAGIDQPITPTSILVRKFEKFGCEAVPPAGTDPIFFVQRGGTTVRSVHFADDVDDLVAEDMLLNAEHIAYSRIKRVVLQVGRPDILWAVREDGMLVGMSTHKGEQVTGWHRHEIGGVDAKVLDVQVLQRTDKDDQLWVVTERTVDGVTRRFTEVMTDPVEFDDPADFFTGEGNEVADLARFHNAVFRRQEEYIHMDAARTFNGSDIGFISGPTTTRVTLTPGATTGTGVAFTASECVFRSTDVGRLLVKKPDRDSGIGAGQATITAVVSEKIVTCDITTDFDVATAIAAGDWYITATTLFGLHHLEGETVAVVVDGGVISDGLTGTPVVVAGGKITLVVPAAVAHVGLPYQGILETHNLEIGGESGPAQAKPRNIVEMSIRFLNTLGIKFGTKLYDLRAIDHEGDPLEPTRPDPVFSGIKKLANEDNWEEEGEKRVVLAQRTPLPAVVQFVDVRYDTGDIG